MHWVKAMLAALAFTVSIAFIIWTLAERVLYLINA